MVTKIPDITNLSSVIRWDTSFGEQVKFTCLRIQLNPFIDQGYLRRTRAARRTQTLLDDLDLGRYGREHTLIQPIELVKAPPGADLAYARKDPTHGLEVERFVATEHEHETS